MRPKQFFFDAVGQAVLFTAAVMVHQQVTRQAAQPDGKGSFARPEAAECTVNAQEDLLRQVLRLGIAIRKAVADGIDPFGIGLHQLIPAVLLAGQAPLNQV